MEKKPQKDTRPSNFPLRLPDDLRADLQEIAAKHKLSVTDILISGGRKEVERLRKVASVI